MHSLAVDGRESQTRKRRVADELFGLEQQLVLVTHDLKLVTRCERVLVVADGAVAFDGPADRAVAHYRAAVGA